MPKRNLLVISLLLSSLTFSCHQQLQLKNFDSEAWRNDKNSCDSVRTKLKQDLLNNKSAIIGESERDIIETLGKPDKVELFAKNTRHLIYFTEPGPECNGAGKKNPERLVIEINSLGQASLLYLKTP